MPFPKPTLAEVSEWVRSYKDRHSCGGSLHVVLDDGNIKDSAVQACIEAATEARDWEGLALAQTLMRMSQRQRAALCRGGGRRNRGTPDNSLTHQNARTFAQWLTTQTFGSTRQITTVDNWWEGR